MFVNVGEQVAAAITLFQKVEKRTTEKECETVSSAILDHSGLMIEILYFRMGSSDS